MNLKPKSLLKRNIKLLSWFNFFTDFVFFAPVAIIYFSKVTGSVTLGMSVFSVAYVSAAIFELPTGIISDLVGRRKTTILGAICSVICIILYAIGGSVWMLFLGAIIQGLSRSFYSGNNEAFLHDTLRESGEVEQYHVYLGKTSSMFQVALALASMVGGFMAAWSFKLVMWASVVPQLCALALAYQMVEPTIHSREASNIYDHLKDAFGQFRYNYRLRLLTSASIIRFSLGESAYFLRSAFVNTLWPLWAVGIAQMLSNMSGALSFYVSGKFINRFGALKILNFEIVSSRVVNLIALIFPSIISPVLLASSSLTYGAGQVATSSLLQKEFSTNQRATMGSLNSFGGSIAFGFFAILLGFIADRTNLATSLIISQLLFLTPLYLYRKVFVHERANEVGMTK